MITVRELIKYTYGIPEFRVVDQPLETLFYGHPSTLREAPKYEYILTRKVESFSITSLSTLTITLEEPSPKEKEEKKLYQEKYRSKNNYGQRRMEG